jgi:hypothetical protein
MASIWRKAIMLPSIGEEKGILLVESSNSEVSLHELCIYAYIISQARQLRVVFISSATSALKLGDILPRYFDKFDIVDEAPIGPGMRLWLLLISLGVWVSQLVRKDLVNLRWHEELVGDVVYDQYLAGCRKGSVDYRDLRLAKYIYVTLRAVERSRKLLKKILPATVLLSHRVGLGAAPIAVVCEQLDIPIYSYGGGEYGTLVVSTKRKTYEYRATTEELAPLLDISPVKFDRIFEAIQEDLFKGLYNADSKLAFANKLYTDRLEFSDVYRLDITKKNIFVMMHAFTDYPHSHFNGMLFDDFRDWFLQTLGFASQHKNVNWIFKQHPAAHFYPVDDVDWQELVNGFTSENLIFMPQGADFDSRSICYVGDATVTCVGSAGFEFAALAGIPTITAGDNPYATSGFAIYPQSRSDYFATLSGLSTLPKLNDAALKKAKAAFIFIHRMSRVPMHASLSLSHGERRELQYGGGYFSKIDSHAAVHECLIASELSKYVTAVADPAFRALRSSPHEY